MSRVRQRMYPRIPLWALIAVAVSLCVFLGSQFLMYEGAISTNGDILAYERVATQLNAIRAGQMVGVPDYYPPFANILFLSAENNIFSLPFHQGLLMLFLIGSFAAIVFATMCIGAEDVRWFVVAIPLSIALLEPAVFFARFDFFPMLMVLLSCLCLRRKHYEFAGVFLMLGCMLKLFPVFLIPLFHVIVPQEKRVKFWLGMGVAAGCTLAASFFIVGIATTIESLKGFFILRTTYPPYALSTASSIDLMLRMILGGNAAIEWVAPDLGHFNVGLAEWLSPLLLLCAAAGSGFIAYRATLDTKSENNIVLYASATLLWLLFATPLLTMHYYLWVLPLLLLWFLEYSEEQWNIRPWQAVVGVGAVLIGLLGHWTYPSLYFDLVDYQKPLAVTVNFARNILVLLTTIACLAAVKEMSEQRKNP